MSSKKSKFQDLFDTRRGAEPTVTELPAEQPASRAEHPVEPSAPPQAKRPSKEQGGKYKDPNYQKVTTYLKGDTYRAARMVLLQEGSKVDFSELVEELVAKWLQEKKGSVSV